jgi:hypothetical protein
MLAQIASGRIEALAGSIKVRIAAHWQMRQSDARFGRSRMHERTFSNTPAQAAEVKRCNHLRVCARLHRVAFGCT